MLTLGPCPLCYLQARLRGGGSQQPEGKGQWGHGTGAGPILTAAPWIAYHVDMHAGF